MSPSEIRAAFIVAKSAPWMNGIASAKAMKESVGIGQLVAESRPPELTARSRSGKTSGKATFAGWRSVLTTERRASRATWSPKASFMQPAGGLSSLGGLGLVGGALGQRPVFAGEDVVEGGLVELEVVDLHSSSQAPGRSGRGWLRARGAGRIETPWSKLNRSPKGQ